MVGPLVVGVCVVLGSWVVGVSVVTGSPVVDVSVEMDSFVVGWAGIVMGFLVANRAGVDGTKILINVVNLYRIEVLVNLHKKVF